MARLTKGPGDKVIAGQKRVANAAKVAANKAKVEANRKKVQANAAKYKTSTSKTSTKKSPALDNQKVATKTAAAAAQKMGGTKMLGYIRGATGADMGKLPKMDSTTFVKTLSKAGSQYMSRRPNEKGTQYGFDPTLGIRVMKADAKKYPGSKFSDFKFDPKTGSFEYNRSTPKKK